MFFRPGAETFDQYIKNKVLFFLLQKYTRSNLNKEDIDNSYNSAKKDLELIYIIWQKIYSNK